MDNERVRTPAQEARISQFAELLPPPGATVFLGDSLTEGGLWQEWFPDLLAVNRGIGGDTVRGLRARLAQSLNDPRAVCLLIGTNDLTFADDIDPIVDEFRLLANEIREFAPDALVVVNSVMPRSPAFRAKITTLNQSYREIAQEVDATWIDLWPILADAEGGLAPRFTYDELHLRGPGYRVWAETLRPHLR